MNNEKDIRNEKDSVILKRLSKYVKPYKFSFLLALILMLTYVVISLLQPIMYQTTIDTIVYKENTFMFLLIILLIYAVLVLIGSAINYFSSVLLQKVGQRIIYDIRDEVFKHMEDFSIDYFNNNQIGSLTTRLTSDINSMSLMFSNIIVNVVNSCFTIVLIAGVMFYYSPKITFYAFCILPFVLVGSLIFRKYTRVSFREIRKNNSKLNAFIAENLSGMKIVQLFNQEDEKYEEFTNKNEELKKSHIKQLTLFSIYRPAIYFVYMLATCLAYYFGGLDVMNGTITIGILVLMAQYITKFFEPIQSLAEQYNTIQQSFACAERVFSILDTKKSVKEQGEVVKTNLLGKIEFKNVWFSYVDEEWVLKDISFTINPKESCAFVGATGAGKTTILQLITRNYDVQKGEILIDDINIKEYDLNSLRKLIGQMLQDVFMFSGTISSNITLRDDTFTKEEIIEACKYVNADKFIEKLDKTYDEEVRERGNNFSTGQRQLLSFARTVIHKPNLMILDEATSNIDTETEELIQNSLEKMMNVGTMLIVAHRLSTIQKVDKIVVLNKGEILEMGSHQELLKLRGAYYNLYEMQYRK